MSKYKNTKYGTKTLKMAQKDLWWYKNLCINDTIWYMYALHTKKCITEIYNENDFDWTITTYRYKYLSLAILIFIDLYEICWYLSKNMWGKHTWLLIQLRHTNGRWRKPHTICRRKGNEGCRWWTPRLQVQHQSLQQCG